MTTDPNDATATGRPLCLDCGYSDAAGAEVQAPPRTWITPDLCGQCANKRAAGLACPPNQRGCVVPRMMVASLLNSVAAGYAWARGVAQPHLYAPMMADMQNCQTMYRILAEWREVPAVAELLEELARLGARDAKLGGPPRPPADEPNADGTPRVLRPGDPDFPKV